nr:hypothetical protein [Tanacetum cinerariifolium]
MDDVLVDPNAEKKLLMLQVMDDVLVDPNAIFFIDAPDNPLNETYLVVVRVVDDENILVDSEIQVMDDVLVDSVVAP